MLLASLALLGCGTANDDPDLGEAAQAATSLGVEVTYAAPGYRVMAVRGGTILATAVGQSSGRLYASADAGRTWTQRTKLANGVIFKVMNVLKSGTLLADAVDLGGAHLMMRSADAGATWTSVMPLGRLRWLQPHSVTDLDGTVYFAEYQVDASLAPVTVHASADDGLTWAPRYTFQGFRHAHGLLADPLTHTLWCFLGDPTGAILRSSDAGATWITTVTGEPGVAVDGIITPSGRLLYGTDLTFRKGPNGIYRRRAEDGYLQKVATLPGPSYSVQHRNKGGGYLLGETREPVEPGVASVYDPADVSAHLFSSGDSSTWKEVFALPRKDPEEFARIDVYWQLPTGEAVLTVRNVIGLGIDGDGFLLAKTATY